MDVKDKLFKFGEDVRTSAGKLAKGAIDGSKKMAEKVKIKNSLSQAESRLNAVYIEIGKKYEELYSEQGDEHFTELLAQGAEARLQIAQAKVELAALDSASICEGCGKYVMDGQRFCPYCGLKQPEPVQEVVEAEEVPVEEEVPAVETEVVETEEETAEEAPAEE